MNKKKIKKLARLFHEEFIKNENELRPMKATEISTGDWSEYDSAVSDKFKNIILNIINYKNNININIDTK